MKHSILIAIAFVFTTVIANAQASNGTELTNGPVITFTETAHNFGSNIPKGDQGAEHEFTFKNTGNEPLILSNVRANCGCTTPKYSTEPILPGKTGVVSAKYTTTQRPGYFKKQITVSSNATNGVQILTIEGTVVENVSSDVMKNDEGSPKAN